MTTFQFLLLLFIIVPVFEIYLLITVGSVIGGLTTVLLVIFTAILGTYLLRIQGLSTLQKAQSSMDQGQIPAGALLEGILLLISGALLLTPGFVTDAIGFSCLIPPIRQAIVNSLIKNIKINPNQNPHQQTKRPDVIEGEYRRDD
ncbi:FxsA family protein [Candidatus Halobeggiatoa sp. HSG11]|nr:FxsA family protein [Candidatus Halobeggiatoa sp. HSG11]